MALEKMTMPMVGKIVKLNVQEGDSVNDGDILLMFESMKLEMPLIATASGKVKDLKVKEGQVVEAEEYLLSIEF